VASHSDVRSAPDFSYIGWFSMLFAAGMGIGLMFYGVAEPMSHFDAALGGITMENGVRTDWAPLGGAEGSVEGARRLGMAATIFHCLGIGPDREFHDPTGRPYRVYRGQPI
jgi:hypothetical protein